MSPRTNGRSARRGKSAPGPRWSLPRWTRSFTACAPNSRNPGPSEKVTPGPGRGAARVSLRLDFLSTWLRVAEDKIPEDGHRLEKKKGPGERATTPGPASRSRDGPSIICRKVGVNKNPTAAHHRRVAPQGFKPEAPRRSTLGTLTSDRQPPSGGKGRRVATAV
jgi:hypothetical protein